MRCPVSIHMILVFLLAVLSGGCGTGYETEMEKQRETLSPYEVDGEVPPYGRNYNFIVTADSLRLKGEANDRQETVLHKRDAIVVSEFSVAGSDSAEMLWVKVARDQSSQGWISGAELTGSTVPADPVSQFLMLFGRNKCTYFICALLCFLFFFALRKMKRKSSPVAGIVSAYPSVLCFVAVLSSTVYVYVSRHSPELWAYYFYNPVLNPFELPLPLSVLVSCVWLMVMMLVAVIDDLTRVYTVYTFYNLMIAFSGCVICYILPVLLCGYSLTAVYLFFLFVLVVAVRNVVFAVGCRYRCGNCGSILRDKGSCHWCGYDNV